MDSGSRGSGPARQERLSPVPRSVDRRDRSALV